MHNYRLSSYGVEKDEFRSSNCGVENDEFNAYFVSLPNSVNIFNMFNVTDIPYQFFINPDMKLGSSSSTVEETNVGQLAVSVTTSEQWVRAEPEPKESRTEIVIF